MDLMLTSLTYNHQIQAGAQSFPEGTSGFLYLYKQAVGGTMSAELRFRLVPPGTSFWDGRNLERAGKVWRCGLRILCKWQPATMAALADAGHIPRAFYEEARTAVGLSRLHQGFVLEDDYDETGSRPLRWRYPSVIKRLALKDPRAARFRRRGPRVSYQRRVPRYKSPRRLSLMEHKQVSTLDPSKLTDADRVDARDLRGIVLSVPSGAGTEDKPIEINILASRTGRFPLDAIGFIYWHDPPNRPPWGGAFRFRVAPPGTAFADGHDLVSPTAPTSPAPSAQRSRRASSMCSPLFLPATSAPSPALLLPSRPSSPTARFHFDTTLPEIYSVAESIRSTASASVSVRLSGKRWERGNRRRRIAPSIQVRFYVISA